MNSINLLKSLLVAGILILAIIIQPSTLTAEDGDGADADLVRASQNPIASLTSIPFQFNFNGGLGEYNRIQTLINIEPVIPYVINEKWNIINRVIIPVLAQPDVTSETGTTGGIGNTNYTPYLAPPAFKKTEYGFGPSFGIPTRTNEKLGPPEFTVGPSIVFFSSVGKFTFGFLSTQNFSIINDNLNNWFVEWFVNYNMPKSWSIGMSPTITANWKAADGQKWVVPFGLSVTKVQKLGKQASKFSLSGYGNAIRPDEGPNWNVQFAFYLLFPK